MSALSQPSNNSEEQLPLTYRHLVYTSQMAPPLNALADINTAIKADPSLNNITELSLIRAKLLLSLDYTNQAHDILVATKANDNTEQQKNELLLVLADKYYKLGQYERSRDVLKSVSKNLSREQEHQYLLQTGMTHLAQGDFKKAANVLEDVSGRTIPGTYARYNLGVALLNLKKFDDGIEELDELGQSNFREEELKSLKDYANISLGFLFMRAQDPALAKKYLSRVRLDATLSNRALLGMGWASIMQQNNKEALLPLLELHDRPKTDNTVIEAYLAVPHALNSLKSDNHALDYYDQAITLFEQQVAVMGNIMRDLTDHPEKIGQYLQSNDTVTTNSKEEIMMRMNNALISDPIFFNTLTTLNKLEQLKQDAAFWPEQIQQSTNAGHYPVEKKALMAQMQELSKKLDSAISKQQLLLSKIVHAALLQEVAKFNRNINQARLAMAQIYDKVLNQRIGK